MAAKYLSASGKRKLKDLYDGEEISVQRCHTLLAVTGFEADLGKVESWTEEQRRHVANYAYRAHLRASDNAIEQIAKPEFMEA